MSDELKSLKSLVRKFLKVTNGLPLRQVDMSPDRDDAYELLDRLYIATLPARKRRKREKAL